MRTYEKKFKIESADLIISGVETYNTLAKKHKMNANVFRSWVSKRKSGALQGPSMEPIETRLKKAQTENKKAGIVESCSKGGDFIASQIDRLQAEIDRIKTEQIDVMQNAIEALKTSSFA